MSSSFGNIGCLVARVAIGKLGKPFQQEVERFLNRNGQEWTANRLKSIWTAALHLKEGRPDLSIQIYQSNSISYRKKNGLPIPKGPIGIVAYRFAIARRPSVLRRLSAVLRYYTAIRVPGTVATEKQIRKARSSITGVFTGNHQALEEMGFLLNVIIDRAVRKGLFRISDLSFEDAVIDNLRGTVKYFSPYTLPRSMNTKPFASMELSIESALRVPFALESEVPWSEASSDLRCLLKEQGKWTELNQKFGKISFLQEAGCKARVVFQPSALLQAAFVPLKKALKSSISRSPLTRDCICTDHQTTGADWALNVLHSGGELTSVDLSSATDRFPLELQKEVLNALDSLVESEYWRYSDALQEVVQEPALVRIGRRVENWKYSVGQPMGLNGSFDLFCLSNHLLCTLATYLAKVGKHHFAKNQFVGPLVYDLWCESWICGENAGRHPSRNRTIEKDLDKTLFQVSDDAPFRVLGDDVIFADKDIANIYSSLLKSLGVDVQPSKCFEGRVAEFAGFVFLPSRKNRFTCFRPYKHPAKDYLTNPIEFLYSIGSPVKSLSKTWSKRWEQFRRVLPMLDLDLNPLLKMEDQYQSLGGHADDISLGSLSNQLHYCADGERLILADLSSVSSDTIDRYRIYRYVSTRNTEFGRTEDLGRFTYDPEDYRRQDQSPYERDFESRTKVSRAASRFMSQYDTFLNRKGTEEIHHDDDIEIDR